MKKLSIALMLLTLASCEEPNVETSKTNHLIGTFGHELDVVKIEVIVPITELSIVKFTVAIL